MAEIFCPLCGKPNPDDLENCQFCQARLQPGEDNQSIQPGKAPVRIKTAELDKVKFNPDDEPIRPGQAPTKKNTSELERVLPSWLRAVRGQENGKPADQQSVSSPDEGMFAGTAAESPREELPDWLAGLETESAHDGDEEIPEWLANLQGKISRETSAENEKPQDKDLLSNIRHEEIEEAPAEPLSEPARDYIPDWLASLKTESQSFPETPSRFAETPAEPVSAQEGGDLPDWLSSLKSESQGITETAETPSAMPETPAEPESALIQGEMPDWLTAMKPVEKLSPETGEKQPEEGDLPGAIPNWLADLQGTAETSAAEVTGAPEASLQAKEELPDWLAGVTAAGGSSDSKPALIEDGENAEPGMQTEAAFSMDAPRWLSTLKPEEQVSKPKGVFGQDDIPAEALEPGELPSWVQAMRPVESVLGDVKSQETDEKIVENQGPLAGLSGVLPAEPGLGTLRKPPAYSIKLYTNESQQRHAAHLGQMVTSESQRGQVAKPTGVNSAHILRWVIAAILILAVVIPIIFGTQHVPPFSGYPSEMGPTINQVDGLPVNSPVLIVFDYEPAFTGEMEAAAGPLIDYLIITKGPRLSVVSTLPAGPALAERFMRSTQSAHLYQAGQQYINLGFISGGTSGVLSFIQDPLTSTPALFDEQDVWELPPLVGVHSLSDFSMLIILTDSADTGRVWVEQTTQYLNVVPPMVMVVSAQAEPMIRPYFDADQIQGLVVGLAGGLSFEAVTRPGMARAYWDSFSFGLLAAEVLILGGGIWSFISGFRSRRRNREEGEA